MLNKSRNNSPNYMAQYKASYHLSQSEIRKQILSCILFSHFSDDNVNAILKKTVVMVVKEKEIIFLQGQDASKFFLVVSGELKLTLTSAMGQEKILYIMNAGHTFAEALMFMDKPEHPSSVIAIADSIVLAFPNNIYKSILTRSPGACFGMLDEYAYRIRHLIGEIGSLTAHDATFRVIRYLLKELPRNPLGSLSVELKTPKHVIASRLSVTPETLSRIFAKLEHNGAISVFEKRIILKDINWMQNFLDKA